MTLSLCVDRVLTNPLAYDIVHKFCISLTIANAGLGVIFKPLMNVIRLLMPDPIKVL